MVVMEWRPGTEVDMLPCTSARHWALRMTVTAALIPGLFAVIFAGMAVSGTVYAGSLGLSLVMLGIVIDNAAAIGGAIAMGFRERSESLVSAATFGVGGALMRGSRLAMTSARTVFPARNAARAAGQPYLKARDATAAFRRREAASVSLRRASHYADEVLFHPHGAFAGAHMTATGTLSYLSNRE